MKFMSCTSSKITVFIATTPFHHYRYHKYYKKFIKKKNIQPWKIQKKKSLRSHYIFTAPLLQNRFQLLINHDFSHDVFLFPFFLRFPSCIAVLTPEIEMWFRKFKHEWNILSNPADRRCDRQTDRHTKGALGSGPCTVVINWIILKLSSGCCRFWILHNLTSYLKVGKMSP